MVGGTDVHQVERHGDVAEKGVMNEVFSLSPPTSNLIISRVGVEETKELATGSGVNHLVDVREGERILQACFIEPGELDAYLRLVVRL